MDTDKRLELLMKLTDASNRLDEHESGPLAIGQIGLSIQSCIEVLAELVQEVSEASATARHVLCDLRSHAHMNNLPDTVEEFAIKWALKIWAIVETADWEDGEPVLRKNDIAEISKAVLELNVD